jgi:oligoendopeptidase F
MPSTSEDVKTRREIPEKDRWNVSALYLNFDEWNKDLVTVWEQANAPHWPKLQKYKGQFQQSATILREILDLTFSISRALEKIYTYAHLRHDEEITNDEAKACFQRITALLHDFHQETAWIEPEILELPESTIHSYLVDPQLKDYRLHLEKIVRMRPHTLSADKEELLAMAGKTMQTPPRAFSALNNADIRFGFVKDSTGKEHELTHSLYQLFLRSQDRTLRKNAFLGMHEKYFDLENTMAELLFGEIQSHIFESRAKRFSTSLEAALFPKKIPLSVYRTLIETVRKGLASLHRYIELRKKILNLDELHLYDMYVPLVPSVEIHMTFEEAVEAVIASVAPLGKEYQETLEIGLQKENWVDRFENRHKRSGAYSSGCYDSFPYILMNYRGILRDVFTLAHEAGHSMHSLMSNKNQPYQYSRYPIFVAEVASTFNEELLMDFLLKKSDQKEKRLFLINEKIEDIRGTFFRQTMFAEFELKIHELAEANVPLTPTLLKEIYINLNIDYFGPEACVDEQIAIEWARIPHFYYNFYVYQYATGISAALSLVEKILDQNEEARQQYLSFLKGGSSLFPIDLLKLAGIDMTLPVSVEAVLRKFESLVSELEQLTK